MDPQVRPPVPELVDPAAPSGEWKHWVRGRIARWIWDRRELLRLPVLEIGSRMPNPDRLWNQRAIIPGGATAEQWFGVDLADGPGVDLVANAEDPEFPARILEARGGRRFASALCSETLEHCYRPWQLLGNVAKLLEPGGALIITTLFSFPVHNYPADYWRFTDQCLYRLLVDAGFGQVEVRWDGGYWLPLSDHGEPIQRHALHQHVFATGFLPTT